MKCIVNGASSLLIALKGRSQQQPGETKMRKIMRKNFIFNLALALVVLSGAAVFAAQNETVARALNIIRPEVKVQMSGTVQRNGQAISVETVEMVKTGEILDWKVVSANEGNASARNYRVVGQIPNGTAFVAGSAQAEDAPQVKYSIDGGKTFSAEPMIEERQADGSVKKVPAPASAYTQVQFDWAKDLPAQAQLNAAYRVRVK
jgi:uncharacterized repeat protein (TIGR01451 family)